MIRVNVVVEGQTEELFVRDLLAPHLGQLSVFVAARSVATSPHQRGGLRSYAKARNDILHWLKQDRGAFVSTMFDYYGLPKNFPRPASLSSSSPLMQRLAQLEQAMAEDIGNERFIPYIQLHEFEALLFSDVVTTGRLLGASPAQLRELQHIRDAFETPEHIDDSPESAPSKRLLKLFPGYTKTFSGITAARRIGLPTLRQQCPHFASWLARLESLKA